MLKNYEGNSCHAVALEVRVGITQLTEYSERKRRDNEDLEKWRGVHGQKIRHAQVCFSMRDHPFLKITCDVHLRMVSQEGNSVYSLLLNTSAYSKGSK